MGMVAGLFYSKLLVPPPLTVDKMARRGICAARMLWQMAPRQWFGWLVILIPWLQPLSPSSLWISRHGFGWWLVIISQCSKWIELCEGLLDLICEHLCSTAHSLLSWRNDSERGMVKRVRILLSRCWSFIIQLCISYEIWFWEREQEVSKSMTEELMPEDLLDDLILVHHKELDTWYISSFAVGLRQKIAALQHIDLRDAAFLDDERPGPVSAIVRQYCCELSC